MHCLQEDSFFRRGLSSSPIGVRRDPQTPLPSFLCAKAVAHFRWKRQGEGAGFTDPVGGRRRCRCLGAVQRRLGVVRGVCCDRLYCTYRGDRASATVVDVRPPLDVGPRKEHAPRTPTISPSSARQRGQSERSQDADGPWTEAGLFSCPVEDVGNVVEAMYGDLPPPVMLIGHSMGGAIAVHTASANLVPSLLGLCMIDVVEGVDRLDKDLTIGQMQGKFQMQVLPQCGHAVHEDAPDKVAEAVATFLIRHRFAEPIGGFQCCLITALQPPLLPRHAISTGREGQPPEAHLSVTCSPLQFSPNNFLPLSCCTVQSLGPTLFLCYL
ncbi:hypothetical protein NN561_005040 [Cricetulus griseus]